MRLFPHVLIRVSGGPFEKLEKLNVDQTMALIHDIDFRKEKVAGLKDKINDALYHIISASPDSKIQNLLLRLKRDIFNERNISAEKIDSAAAYITPEVHADLKSYLQLKEEINHLWGEGARVFSQELTGVRENLIRLAEDENFQKGLLLSSQSLLKRLPIYRAKYKQSLKKSEFQTERSLIKYISRTYAKTSPFSTFTNLAMGALVSRPAAPSADGVLTLADAARPEVISHIRLNNYLYAYLKGLLLKNPEIYRQFPLRPNPTLQRKADQYIFLINSNNIESFQRLPANPVLEVFLELTKEKREGIRYAELIQSIIANEYIDAPAAEIEAYVNRLIEYGFLEFNIGVSGIDPDWDIKLRDQLQALAENLPLIQELLETLKQVRELAQRYGRASLAVRQQILESAYNQFRSVCMKLHEAAGLPAEERKSLEELKKRQAEKATPAEAPKGKPEESAEDEEAEKEDEVFKLQTGTYFYFKPEQMFYEDTSINVTPQLTEAKLADLIACLNDLLQSMAIFEGHLDERDKMTHYFVEKYGRTASVPAFTFYEDYYREFKKPEAEKMEKWRKAAREKPEKPNEEKDPAALKPEEPPAPATIPSIQARLERNKAWLDQWASIVREQMTGSPAEVRLTAEQIGRTYERVPCERDRTENGSYGVFIQLCPPRTPSDPGDVVSVLNASFPGFGKMFSRFLHLFEGAVTADIRDWNQSLTETDLFVEDCDASVFNANLHPPLMPFEVWMPSGQNSLPAEKQIPVTEVLVRLDEKHNRLQLVHEPSGKRIYIFDLGFQGHRGRSQFFQLLEKFTPAEHLFCHPLINAVNQAHKQNAEKEEKATRAPSVIRRPRIIYEDRIILQRQTWLIPQELLPFRQPNEDNWSYFFRIQQWKLAHKMPDEVFVFITPREGLENVEPEARKKIGRDDYKPQYICFKNPLLVNLFERLINKVPSTLKVEEMLPNSEQLFTLAKSRHVTEFVVQWYNRSGDTRP